MCSEPALSLAMDECRCRAEEGRLGDGVCGGSSCLRDGGVKGYLVQGP